MSIYYQDDFVTLYHGDCLELTDWTKCDVLVTDPPYGINIEQRFGSWYGLYERERQKSVIANDKTTVVRDEALKLWQDKPAIVFGSWKMPRPLDTRHRLIWHKQGQAPGPTNSPFMSQDEEIYILGKGFISTSPPMRSVITTKENRSIQVAKIGHPTPKPVGLMELLLARCPDGTIADPFAGSGATLLAARNLGRKVIGVEMEEKYCELIANRLSQQTFDLGVI
jgi:site-specific DNA-methyltransferase (adenine-specific)